MEILINLLPDYRKLEIAKVKRFKMVIWLGLASITILFLFYGFLYGLHYALKTELNTLSASQENSSNKKELARLKELDGKFDEANTSIKQALSPENDQLYWTNLLKLFSDNTIDGITINNLATKDYAVFLVGKADNRDKLMEFKEKLSGEKCFSDVNLPLSNLVSREDISFQMDLKIDKNCLKTK